MLRDPEIEDALPKLLGDKESDEKKLGRLLLYLSFDKSFSSPILVQHKLGYDANWVYNCYRRLRRAGIMYGDKLRSLDEWMKDKTDITFVVDTLVGTGELRKLKNGKYCHKDYKEKKRDIKTCKSCGLKSDSTSYNYCKTDLQIAFPRRSTKHIPVGTKHSWVPNLRGGIEAVERASVPKVDAIRVTSPRKRSRVGEAARRPVNKPLCRVATGIPAAEKPKPDMAQFARWLEKRKRTTADI